MELRLRYGVLAPLLCHLALARSDATSSRSAEQYWRSIWPDTSMPKNLEYLLWSGVRDAENKDNTQYPYTSFFEDDLYAGKQMDIIFNSPYADEEQKSNPTEKDPEKSSWKRNTMINVHENLSIEAICNAKERFVGEDDKFCAESVESLIDFIISKLGKDIEALTSSFVPHQTRYKILEGVKKVSSEGVMCHKLNFEKPVFYCHQVNATITYTVLMEAADGTRTSIVALCHREIRGLDPHKLFHQFKVKPGTVPVCHFLCSGAISCAQEPFLGFQETMSLRLLSKQA